MNDIDRATLGWVNAMTVQEAGDAICRIAAEMRKKEADERNPWATTAVEPTSGGDYAADETQEGER